MAKLPNIKESQVLDPTLQAPFRGSDPLAEGVSEFGRSLIGLGKTVANSQRSDLSLISKEAELAYKKKMEPLLVQLSNTDLTSADGQLILEEFNKASSKFMTEYISTTGLSGLKARHANVAMGFAEQSFRGDLIGVSQKNRLKHRENIVNTLGKDLSDKIKQNPEAFQRHFLDSVDLFITTGMTSVNDSESREVINKLKLIRDRALIHRLKDDNRYVEANKVLNKSGAVTLDEKIQTKANLLAHQQNYETKLEQEKEKRRLEEKRRKDQADEDAFSEYLESFGNINDPVALMEARLKMEADTRLYKKSKMILSTDQVLVTDAEDTQSYLQGIDKILFGTTKSQLINFFSERRNQIKPATQRALLNMFDELEEDDTLDPHVRRMLKDYRNEWKDLMETTMKKGLLGTPQPTAIQGVALGEGLRSLNKAAKEGGLEGLKNQMQALRKRHQFPSTISNPRNTRVPINAWKNQNTMRNYYEKLYKKIKVLRAQGKSDKSPEIQDLLEQMRSINPHLKKQMSEDALEESSRSFVSPLKKPETR